MSETSMRLSGIPSLPSMSIVERAFQPDENMLLVDQYETDPQEDDINRLEEQIMEDDEKYETESEAEIEEEEVEKPSITTDQIFEFFKTRENKRNNKLMIDQMNEEKKLMESLSGCDNNLHSFIYDFKQIKQLMESEFYGYEVMKVVQCALKYLLKDISDLKTNISVKRYFKQLVKIGTESSFGNVYSSKFEDENTMFVLKTKQSIDRSSFYIIHEIFIGLIMNTLREDVLNFIYTFGDFQCSPPLNPSTHIFTYCKNSDVNVEYAIIQNIQNSSTLYEFISDGCTPEDFLNIYLQILYALSLANIRYDYTHYDLHTDNILIKIYDKKFYLPYTTEKGKEYLLTDSIAYIIDFGLSHIKYNNKDYSIDGFEKYGQYLKSYYLHDAYKLLCFSMKCAFDNEHRFLFQSMIPIFRFFNSINDPIDAIVRQSELNYFLPPIGKFPNMTIFDLTKYIRSILATPFLHQTRNEETIILNCKESNLCLNTSEIEAQIKVNNVPPNDFTELYHAILLSNLEVKENFDFIKIRYDELLPAELKSQKELEKELKDKIRYIKNQEFKVEYSEVEIYILDLQSYIFDLIEVSDILDQYRDKINIYYEVSKSLKIEINKKIDISNIKRFTELKNELLKSVKEFSTNPKYKALTYKENAFAYIFYKKNLEVYLKLI